MFRQALVFFLVTLEMLFGAALHAAIDQLVVACLILIDALEHEEFLPVENHLRVDGIAGAAAERKIIDGIQKIRLSLTIMPYEAIHLGRQLQRCRLNILIVDDGNFL